MPPTTRQRQKRSEAATERPASSVSTRKNDGSRRSSYFTKMTDEGLADVYDYKPGVPNTGNERTAGEKILGVLAVMAALYGLYVWSKSL